MQQQSPPPLNGTSINHQSVYDPNYKPVGPDGQLIPNYGTPPPGQQYNTPPPGQQYNTPPPGQQYNTPPPGQQYNTPPQQYQQPSPVNGYYAPGTVPDRNLSTSPAMSQMTDNRVSQMPSSPNSSTYGGFQQQGVPFTQNQPTIHEAGGNAVGSQDMNPNHRGNMHELA
jgi:hypothetical protein